MLARLLTNPLGTSIFLLDLSFMTIVNMSSSLSIHLPFYIGVSEGDLLNEAASLLTLVSLKGMLPHETTNRVQNSKTV